MSASPERRNIEGPAAMSRSEVDRPSLIPDDVWTSYQREVEEAQSDQSARELEETASLPRQLAPELLPELVSAESLVDEEHLTPADPEEGLLALTQVHLFAKVSRPSLEFLVRDAYCRVVPDGDYLFREGDHAGSFHVVMEGTIEVLRLRDDREVALRHMGRGDAVGLFGLFSGQIRAACARAIGNAVVLEISCSTLNQVVRADEALHDRLVTFYQERLLEGFLGSSRLFADVDSVGRARLIGRFKSSHLRPGETLVQPGEVSHLLAVVISGSLHLESAQKAGLDPRTYELTAGQFVVVTGALSGIPSRMRIFAAEDTTLALLDHRELAAMVRDYPALRAMPQRLPSSARALDRDVHCGHTGVPGL